MAISGFLYSQSLLCDGRTKRIGGEKFYLFNTGYRLAIVVVRCNETYSLWCGHLEHLWLEGSHHLSQYMLELDFIASSDASWSQTLYHRWTCIVLTHMACIVSTGHMRDMEIPYRPYSCCSSSYGHKSQSRTRQRQSVRVL